MKKRKDEKQDTEQARKKVKIVEFPHILLTSLRIRTFLQSSLVERRCVLKSFVKYCHDHMEDEKSGEFLSPRRTRSGETTSWIQRHAEDKKCMYNVIQDMVKFPIRWKEALTNSDCRLYLTGNWDTTILLIKRLTLQVWNTHVIPFLTQDDLLCRFGATCRSTLDMSFLVSWKWLHTWNASIGVLANLIACAEKDDCIHLRQVVFGEKIRSWKDVHDIQGYEHRLSKVQHVTLHSKAYSSYGIRYAVHKRELRGFTSLKSVLLITDFEANSTWWQQSPGWYDHDLLNSAGIVVRWRELSSQLNDYKCPQIRLHLIFPIASGAICAFVSPQAWLNWLHQGLSLDLGDHYEHPHVFEHVLIQFKNVDPIVQQEEKKSVWTQRATIIMQFDSSDTDWNSWSTKLIATKRIKHLTINEPSGGRIDTHLLV